MSLFDFYRSKEWERFRKVVINERMTKEGFTIDEYTGKPIVKNYDIILHHIEPLTEENYTDANISLNPENIMLVSHKSHNLIHNKLSYSCRQVFIVHGSPLSGKTSYVEENMLEGDLIIDMDSIWQCISGQERYVKPNRLKSVVFAVRDNLLESVKYRRGKWLNAYIIQSLPISNDRDRLANTLGARLIHIDTDKETCLQRLHDNPCGRDINEWTKYIDDYFRDFEMYG